MHQQLCASRPSYTAWSLKDAETQCLHTSIVQLAGEVPEQAAQLLPGMLLVLQRSMALVGIIVHCLALPAQHSAVDDMPTAPRSGCSIWT